MKSQLLAGLLLGGMLWIPGVAHAQNNVTPATGGRLAVVDIKDATLKDALDLVFDSVGIKSRSIDASAAAVVVPDLVRSNIAWDDLVRSLCLTYNYRFSRNRDGLYVIEPRVPVGLNPDGSATGATPGGFPGASGRPGGGVSSAPANPFGFGGAPQGTTNRGNRLVVPEVQTLSNAQTTPRGGRGRGGNTRGTGTNPLLKYTPIIVRHVYSGGIARLFNGGEVITTAAFVSPGINDISGNSNTNGGNGSGVNSSGGGGFGGGIGGSGGGIGGIGGGGGIGGIGGGGGFGGGF